MADSWYSTTTSGDASWFTVDWSTSVEQDSTCTYQLYDWTTDDSVYTWYAVKDGIANTWFVSDAVPVSTTSVQQDSPVVSYAITFSVYSTSITLSYDVESSIGYIGGGGEFPYGSVERDFTDTYTVFYLINAQRDFTDSYRIVNYADNVAPSVYYRVLNSVTTDAVLSYESAGYVEQSSPTSSYDVIVTAERDTAAVTYRIVTAVTQDSTENTYDIVTTPLSAGRSEVVTYQVRQEINSYSIVTYDVLLGAEKDYTAIYDVAKDVTTDFVLSYNVQSSVARENVVVYDVFGKYPIFRSQLVSYNINALSSQVPNVIGLTLNKATKRLEQSGFKLGQITYQ